MKTKAIAAVGFIYLVLFIIEYIIIINIENKFLLENALWILLGLLIASIILSYGKVDVDEIGAVFFFGIPLGDIGKGPYLSLFGIVSVKKEKGTFFQDELPADPELVFHDKGDIIPVGMFPPIRVKFGQPDEKDKNLKDDPYNIAMVAEIVPVVSWYISNLTIFLAKMGNVKNCRKNLTDKVIAVCNDDFSKVTPAKALLELDQTSQKIEETLRKETTDWGIQIRDAYVKPFIFSHGLNKAVVGVSEAKERAKATKTDADAERYKRTEEGTGEADAKRLLFEAEAVGLKKLVKVCGKEEGQIVLWMKTLSEALKSSQYSIIPGSDLFASVSGIKEMLEKIKGGK